MKAAIVTITCGNNYGNRLQNYALQNKIESYGIEVQTLNNDNARSLKGRIKGSIKFLLKPNIGKKLKFRKFNKEHIKFSKYTITNELDKIDPKIQNEYDYFVCGSDQIWNPSFRNNAEANFLQFAPKEKRIAYAPSFGVNEMPETREDEYRKYLEGFENISVREIEGANIIKKLTGKEAEVLVDPTLLLEKKEWDKIIKEENIDKENYIFEYFLGNNCYEEEIKKFANNEGYETIDINEIQNSIGPSEFLGLINKAKIVCTDSFHGCVFSMILNKPFIVFERKDKNVSMNSRINTLLKKFNLENRRYDGTINKDFINCDYTEAYEILKDERKKADEYLKRALNIN